MFFDGFNTAFWTSVTQSSEQAPFTSDIVASILATNSCELNALPKFVGFFRVFPFPPTGQVDRVGQGEHN
jgi:hypothetical protein